MTTQQYSTNQPKEAAYLVYLNGIEIPAVNATVGMTANELPFANITVAPDMSMLQLGKEDRVEVQIFYKDDIHTAVEGKAPDFRLLFDGEISGWSYVATGRTRQIQFKCVHASQILETLNPYFITGPESMAMSAYGAPTGRKAEFLHGGPTFPWSVFFYGFNTPMQKELIKRPYDFIENIFRSCMDIKHAPQLGSTVTSNFYSRHMKKLGLPFRFLPSPILEIEPLSDPDALGAFPVLKAVRSKLTLDALYRKTAETGLGGNLWESTQGLFQQMYYEILSISTPPIALVEMTPGSVHRGMVLGKPQWKFASTNKKNAAQAAAEKALFKARLNDTAAAIRAVYAGYTHLSAEEYETQAREKIAEEKKRLLEEFRANAAKNKAAIPKRPNFLINHITKPQWLFGIPPACNVVFPSMIKEMQYDEDYLGQPTRLYVNDLTVPELTGASPGAQEAQSTLRYAYPEQVEYEMSKRQGGVKGAKGNPLISGKNLLVWPEEFFKGPNSKQVRAPGWLTFLYDAFQTNQTVEEKLAQKALDMIDENVTDIWFKAQDQARMEYELKGVDDKDLKDEDKAEQERKEMERRDAIEAEMLKKLFGDGPMQTLIKELKEQGLVSGSVTTLEQLKEKLSQRANNHSAKMQVLKRTLARYEYHRLRSGMRRGAVTMSFNPYIVPGFPAVIFDYFTHGQHFIGNVVSVTHTVSSKGWETSIQFVHGQTLDEFVREIFDARVGNNADGVQENVNAGPPTPIPDLRAVLQHQDKAEDYFSQLFHQAIKEYGEGGVYSKGRKIKQAAFDITKAILFIVPGTTKDFDYTFDNLFDAKHGNAKEVQAANLEREAKDEAKVDKILKERIAELKDKVRKNAEVAVAAAAVSAATKGVAPSVPMSVDTIVALEMEKVTADQEIIIREIQYEQKLKREFTEPKKALPNKILDNYTGIRPTHAFAPMFGNHDVAMKYISRPICTLNEYVSFRGKYGKKRNMVRADDSRQGKGAVYYEQILDLTPGPGEAPTFDENNFLVNPLPKDLPDTRKDWNAQLKNYRTKILFGTAPDSPKE